MYATRERHRPTPTPTPASPAPVSPPASTSSASTSTATSTSSASTSTPSSISSTMSASSSHAHPPLGASRTVRTRMSPVSKRQLSDRAMHQAAALRAAHAPPNTSLTVGNKALGKVPPRNGPPPATAARGSPASSARSASTSPLPRGAAATAAAALTKPKAADKPTGPGSAPEQGQEQGKELGQGKEQEREQGQEHEHEHEQEREHSSQEGQDVLDHMSFSDLLESNVGLTPAPEHPASLSSSTNPRMQSPTLHSAGPPRSTPSPTSSAPAASAPPADLSLSFSAWIADIARRSAAATATATATAAATASGTSAGTGTGRGPVHTPSLPLSMLQLQQTHAPARHTPHPDQEVAFPFSQSLPTPSAVPPPQPSEPSLRNNSLGAPPASNTDPLSSIAALFQSLQSDAMATPGLTPASYANHNSLFDLNQTHHSNPIPNANPDPNPNPNLNPNPNSFTAPGSDLSNLWGLNALTGVAPGPAHPPATPHMPVPAAMQQQQQYVALMVAFLVSRAHQAQLAQQQAQQQQAQQHAQHHPPNPNHHHHQQQHHPSQQQQQPQHPHSQHLHQQQQHPNQPHQPHQQAPVQPPPPLSHHLANMLLPAWFSSPASSQPQTQPQPQPQPQSHPPPHAHLQSYTNLIPDSNTNARPEIDDPDLYSWLASLAQLAGATRHGGEPDWSAFRMILEQGETAELVAATGADAAGADASGSGVGGGTPGSASGGDAGAGPSGGGTSSLSGSGRGRGPGHTHLPAVGLGSRRGDVALPQAIYRLVQAKALEADNKMRIESLTWRLMNLNLRRRSTPDAAPPDHLFGLDGTTSGGPGAVPGGGGVGAAAAPASPAVGMGLDLGMSSMELDTLGAAAAGMGASGTDMLGALGLGGGMGFGAAFPPSLPSGPDTTTGAVPMSAPAGSLADVFPFPFPALSQPPIQPPAPAPAPAPPRPSSQQLPFPRTSSSTSATPTARASDSSRSPPRGRSTRSSRGVTPDVRGSLTPRSSTDPSSGHTNPGLSLPDAAGSATSRTSVVQTGLSPSTVPSASHLGAKPTHTQAHQPHNFSLSPSFGYRFDSANRYRSRSRSIGALSTRWNPSTESFARSRSGRRAASVRKPLLGPDDLAEGAKHERSLDHRSRSPSRSPSRSCKEERERGSSCDRDRDRGHDWSSHDRAQKVKDEELIDLETNNREKQQHTSPRHNGQRSSPKTSTHGILKASNSTVDDGDADDPARYLHMFSASLPSAAALAFGQFPGFDEGFKSSDGHRSDMTDCDDSDGERERRKRQERIKAEFRRAVVKDALEVKTGNAHGLDAPSSFMSVKTDRARRSQAASARATPGRGSSPLIPSGPRLESTASPKHQSQLDTEMDWEAPSTESTPAPSSHQTDLPDVGLDLPSNLMDIGENEDSPVLSTGIGGGFPMDLSIFDNLAPFASFHPPEAGAASREAMAYGAPPRLLASVPGANPEDFSEAPINRDPDWDFLPRLVRKTSFDHSLYSATSPVIQPSHLHASPSQRGDSIASISSPSASTSLAPTHFSGLGNMGDAEAGAKPHATGSTTHSSPSISPSVPAPSVSTHHRAQSYFSGAQHFPFGPVAGGTGTWIAASNEESSSSLFSSLHRTPQSAAGQQGELDQREGENTRLVSREREAEGEGDGRMGATPESEAATPPYSSSATRKRSRIHMDVEDESSEAPTSSRILKAARPLRGRGAPIHLPTTLDQRIAAGLNRFGRLPSSTPASAPSSASTTATASPSHAALAIGPMGRSKTHFSASARTHALTHSYHQNQNPSRSHTHNRDSNQSQSQPNAHTLRGSMGSSVLPLSASSGGFSTGSTSPRASPSGSGMSDAPTAATTPTGFSVGTLGTTGSGTTGVGSLLWSSGSNMVPGAGNLSASAPAPAPAPSLDTAPVPVPSSIAELEGATGAPSAVPDLVALTRLLMQSSDPAALVPLLPTHHTGAESPQGSLPASLQESLQACLQGPLQAGLMDPHPTAGLDTSRSLPGTSAEPVTHVDPSLLNRIHVQAEKDAVPGFLGPKSSGGGGRSFLADMDGLPSPGGSPHLGSGTTPPYFSTSGSVSLDRDPRRNDSTTDPAREKTAYAAARGLSLPSTPKGVSGLLTTSPNAALTSTKRRSSGTQNLTKSQAKSSSSIGASSPSNPSGRGTASSGGTASEATGSGSGSGTGPGSGAGPEDLMTCTNCHTTRTPLWRRDPAGNALCNACGLFFKLHGVVRPLSLKSDVIRKRNRNSSGTSGGEKPRRKSTLGTRAGAGAGEHGPATNATPGAGRSGGATGQRPGSARSPEVSAASSSGPLSRK